MLHIVQHMVSHLYREKKEGISDFLSDYLMVNSLIIQIIFMEGTEVLLGHSLRKKNMAKMNLSSINYVPKILLLKTVKKLR